jgi:hypothetical protein
MLTQALALVRLRRLGTFEVNDIAHQCRGNQCLSHNAGCAQYLLLNHSGVTL